MLFCRNKRESDLDDHVVKENSYKTILSKRKVMNDNIF